MRTTNLALALIALSLAAGCASQDIPQAYRGRMFDRTGPLAFYSGKTGFTGPVLNPGTYFTSTYNELHRVECSTLTVREPLNALTKDGVQFGLNVFIRFSPDCSDQGVQAILGAMPVDEDNDITAMRVYKTYVQPAIGEAVREVVSPVAANDVNNEREQILANIRKRFLEMMAHREHHFVMVYEVNLSNLQFPDDMNRANTERAVQYILRDKAIAEREKVLAEIKTAEISRDLAKTQGEVEAARIEEVGDALRRFPSFLQYDLQQRMPEIYEQAGMHGNMVITAPNPAVFVAARPAAAPGSAAPNPAPAPFAKQTPPAPQPATVSGEPRPAPAAAPVSAPPPNESSDNPYR